MNFLITGSSGYIGSVTALTLMEAGHNVVGLDSGERGNFKHHSLKTIKKDLRTSVRKISPSVEGTESIIHFAAYAYVDESTKKPFTYLDNNIRALLNVLEMSSRWKSRLKSIVLSSTCSIYGDNKNQVLSESEPPSPKNPYADSKYYCEKILREYCEETGVRGVALRYFNVGGAKLTGSIAGEEHTPETHVIPLLINSAIKNCPFIINGTDYDTPDGTCIRDYIHVCDLAEAHKVAAEYASNKEEGYFKVFNVGSGAGHSVLQVKEMVESVIGKGIPVEIGPKRTGDPAKLIADIDLIKETMGWRPFKSGLRNIINDAFSYQLNHRKAHF